MGKVTSASKKVGKNLYFYASLYCIGVIGIIIITISRYDIIIDKLGIVNWGELVLLLGLMYSLPVLALTFVGKVNKSMAIILAGVMSIIIFIVYCISAITAGEMIVNIKTILNPVLGVFFIITAFISIFKIWPKGTR